MTTTCYPDIVLPFTDGINFGCYVCHQPAENSHFHSTRKHQRVSKKSKVVVYKSKTVRHLKTSRSKTVGEAKDEFRLKASPTNVDSRTFRTPGGTPNKPRSKTKGSLKWFVSCFSCSKTREGVVGTDDGC
eukprot:g7174.t1